MRSKINLLILFLVGIFIFSSNVFSANCPQETTTTCGPGCVYMGSTCGWDACYNVKETMCKKLTNICTWNKTYGCTNSKYKIIKTAATTTTSITATNPAANTTTTSTTTNPAANTTTTTTNPASTTTTTGSGTTVNVYVNSGSGSQTNNPAANTTTATNPASTTTTTGATTATCTITLPADCTTLSTTATAPATTSPCANCTICKVDGAVCAAATASTTTTVDCSAYNNDESGCTTAGGTFTADASGLCTSEGACKGTCAGTCTKTAVGTNLANAVNNTVTTLPWDGTPLFDATGTFNSCGTITGTTASTVCPKAAFYSSKTICPKDGETSDPLCSKYKGDYEDCVAAANTPTVTLSTNDAKDIKCTTKSCQWLSSGEKCVPKDALTYPYVISSTDKTLNYPFVGTESEIKAAIRTRFLKDVANKDLYLDDMDICDFKDGKTYKSSCASFDDVYAKTKPSDSFDVEVVSVDCKEIFGADPAAAFLHATIANQGFATCRVYMVKVNRTTPSTGTDCSSHNDNSSACAKAGCVFNPASPPTTIASACIKKMPKTAEEPHRYIYNDWRLAFYPFKNISEDAEKDAWSLDGPDEKDLSRGSKFCSDVVDARFSLEKDIMTAWSILNIDDFIAKGGLKLQSGKEFPSSIAQFSSIKKDCKKQDKLVQSWSDDENKLIKSYTSGKNPKAIKETSVYKVACTPGFKNSLTIPEVYKKNLAALDKTSLKTFCDGVKKEADGTTTATTASTKLKDFLLGSAYADKTTTVTTVAGKEFLEYYLIKVNSLSKAGSNKALRQADRDQRKADRAARRAARGTCKSPKTWWKSFTCSVDATVIAGVVTAGLSVAAFIWEIKKWKEELAWQKKMFEEGTCYPYKSDTSGVMIPITIAGKTVKYSMYDFCKLSASGALAFMDPCSSLLANKAPQAAINACYGIQNNRYTGGVTVPYGNGNVSSTNNNNAPAATNNNNAAKDAAAAAAGTAGTTAGGAASPSAAGNDNAKKLKSPYDSVYTTPYQPSTSTKGFSERYPYAQYDQSANANAANASKTTKISGGAQVPGSTIGGLINGQVQTIQGTIKRKQ